MTFERFSELANEGFNVIPVSTTLQLDRETPVSIYQRLRERAFFLLESAALGEATGRYSFIGLDRQWRLSAPAGRLVADGIVVDDTLAPLEALRTILGSLRTYQPPSLPDFFGGAVGFVTYDYVRRLEKLPKPAATEWPDVDFSFPGTVLICDHLQHSTTIVVNALVEASPRAAYDHAEAVIAATLDALLAPAPPTDPATERLVASAPSRRGDIDVRAIAASLSNTSLDDYEAIVDRAKHHIVEGDIFQVVPSQQFRQPTTVDPLTLYRVLRALNPSPYMYLIDNGDSQIVGASPEMLLRVADGVVSTRPIAGTRRRGATVDDDLALERQLLSDEKEIAEHVMLVDLGRNDVGRVAAPGSVRVERLAHIERFSHLMHIVSDVSGELRDGSDAFDAFNALFPAGTLTGSPKVRAMELIDGFEKVYRGPYGGALGYFSLTGSADFAIIIRTLSLRDGTVTVQAGGGVVADSTGEFEYNECISKASAPLLAHEIARGQREG